MKPSWNLCLTRAVVCVIALSMLAISVRADHNPEHTEAQMKALQSAQTPTAGQDDDCPGAQEIRKRYADANIPLGDGCAVSRGPMSLLGVPSAMGPDVRGTVRALADHHPLRLKLWCKEEALKKIDEEEAKAVKGEGLSWALIVESAQEWSAKYERDLAGATRELAKERQDSAPRKEVIERLSAQVADLQAKLAKEQQRLPWAQKGLAEHEAKLKQAQAAREAAYQAALAEAKKCQ